MIMTNLWIQESEDRFCGYDEPAVPSRGNSGGDGGNSPPGGRKVGAGGDLCDSNFYISSDNSFSSVTDFGKFLG